MDPRGFPTTLPEFQRVFPDPEACATYLENLRVSDALARDTQRKKSADGSVNVRQPDPEKELQ
jgi:hypothetical protein